MANYTPDELNSNGDARSADISAGSTGSFTFTTDDPNSYFVLEMDSENGIYTESSNVISGSFENLVGVTTASIVEHSPYIVGFNLPEGTSSFDFYSNSEITGSNLKLRAAGSLYLALIAGGGLSSLWNGLQAYYTADNTPNDALGTYNGTLTNGATYGTGIISNGFSLDGVNDYVNLGDNLDIRLDSWTYNFWINMDTINRYNSILTKSDTGNNWERWWYIVNTSNQLEFHLQNGTNNTTNRKYFRSTQTLSASTWYMVTMVLDRTDKAYMYINGAPETIIATDGNGTTITNELSSWSAYDFDRTFNCCIGSYSNATLAFDGIIDDGGIWNRVLSSTEVTELYNAGAGKQYPVVRDFLTATGITDSTIVSAINTLTSDLQGYGIWDKLEAIYPFVGGTAETHRYNLKDATQYKIDWNGTITHDSNGVTGDGSTGYGNTNFNDSLFLTNFISFGVYSRTNLTSPAYDMAAINSGFITTRISSRFNASGLYTTALDGSGTSTSSTDSLGLFCSNRTSTTTRQSYIDGVETSHSISGGAYVGENMYVLAQNQSGTANSFSSRNLAFAFIGNSLTTTEHANLYTAVQAFQTTLSRNV